MVSIGELIWDKPQNTGFRFGFIAILLVGIALIYPSFYGVGYSDPMMLQYTLMTIIGLVMSMMFSFVLAMSSRTTMETRLTAATLHKQMVVLIVGVVSGCVAYGINVFLNSGLSVFEASINGAFLGLLAGVGEELFFRGFIQNMIRLYVPFVSLAVVPSAIIFACFHYFAYGLNMTAIIVLFVLGLIFGYLHEIFNDVGVPMIAHIINNTFVMLPVASGLILDNFWLVGVGMFVIVISFVYSKTVR